MDCVDEYSHLNRQIMYFPRCIPTKEVEETIVPSNVFCNCERMCTEEKLCSCMKNSGTHYSYSDPNDLENYVLTLKNGNMPTYECNDQCSCNNSLCGNKVVQCGPRQGLKVRTCNDESKGLGVFTEKLIKCGNFICEYAGEIITEKEASLRFRKNLELKRMNYISCIDEQFGDKNVKTFIDPSFYGNIGRYVNHSCEPNCSMIILRIDDNIPVLGMFASRDIEAGEELSYDYGSTALISANEDTELQRTKCLCGSKTCKGVLPYDQRIS